MRCLIENVSIVYASYVPTMMDSQVFCPDENPVTSTGMGHVDFRPNEYSGYS
jgi:hypothetical protein